MTNTAAAPAAVIRPGWYQALAADKNKGVAHQFLVWGSDDYVIRGYPLERWLAAVLTGTRERPGADVVLRYSIDQGITFQSPSMERLYRTTLGLDPPAAAAASDDLLAQAQAALRSASGAPAAKPGALPSEPDEALAQILQFLALARMDESGEPRVKEGARHAAAIVERLDLILPASDKATMPASRLRLLSRLHRASTDRELQAAGNPLILLSPTLEDVHEDVRAASSGTRAIEVPLPDLDRRLVFIRELAEAGEVDLDMPDVELAAMTAGLYLRHIEDIAQRARGGKLTRPMALERQGELMAAEYGEGLVRLEPTFGFDALGGNDHLKERLRKRVIDPMRSGDPEQKQYVPMGVLFSGPAGTGKTALAMATAYEAGINAVQVTDPQEKWVGSSGRNLAKRIRGIKAFTPCVVFVDEYDKWLAGGGEAGEGNSVDAGLRKMWQEFTGDTSHRGDILLLAATNYPKNILPALIRTGRVDWKVPLLAPATAAERAEILARLLKRYRQPEVADLLALGELTENWTGSDLEAAVVKACGSVKVERLSVADALRDAIDTILPSDPASVRKMTRDALEACNDLALLPPEYRERARKVQQAAAETAPEGEPEGGATRRTGGLEL